MKSKSFWIRERREMNQRMLNRIIKISAKIHNLTKAVLSSLRTNKIGTKKQKKEAMIQERSRKLRKTSSNVTWFLNQVTDRWSRVTTRKERKRRMNLLPLVLKKAEMIHQKKINLRDSLRLMR